MATCHRCGCSIPAGKGVRRNVQVGSSSGQTHRVDKYGRRRLSGSISNRAYFATRTFCRDCSQLGTGGSTNWGGVGLIVFVLVMIAVGFGGNGRNTPVVPNAPGVKSQPTSTGATQSISTKTPEGASKVIEQKKLEVSQLSLGAEALPNGSLSRVSDQFEIGEPIYLSIATSPSSGPGLVDVRWSPLGRRGVGGNTGEIRLAGGGDKIAIPIFPRADSKGDYGVEVFSLGELVMRKNFFVVDGERQSGGEEGYGEVSLSSPSDDAVASSERKENMTAEECRRRHFEMRGSRNFLPTNSDEYNEFRKRDLAMIQQCDELERGESRRRGYR